MKAKKSKMSTDSTGNNAFYVDLNDPQLQEKVMHYVRSGIAASDKNGHQIRLQVRCTPIQGDILESIRAKAPKGYWKTPTALLRTVIAVGSFITLKILNASEGISSFDKEFKMLDLINLIAQKSRENDLASESRKVISDLNLSGIDLDGEIKKLENVVSMFKQSKSNS